jgi:hypothetical protein
MLARQGQSTKSIWLVLVSSGPLNQIGGVMDHLVTVVKDSLGEFWVVGDTSGEIIKLSEMRYRPIAYAEVHNMKWISAEDERSFADAFGIKTWKELIASPPEGQ